MQYITFAVFFIGVCVSAKSNQSSCPQLQECCDAARKTTYEIAADQMLHSMCKQMEFQMRSQALITGPANYVPDKALTASSSHDNRMDHGPGCSRLLIPRPNGCYSQAWQRRSNDASGWIQADLGSVHHIHSVATQGRGNTGQWVTSYYLASYNGRTVYFYGNFAGNTDQHSVVKHYLTPPLITRRVRLYPKACKSRYSLRWEVYGYKPFC